MLLELHDTALNRKYITREERQVFLQAAAKCLGETRTLCSVLAYTGCHLTEALELTFERVDVKKKVLTFESLRKRRAGVFRSVPVPPQLIDTLDQVHHVRERRGRGRYRFLWSWSRPTAWRRVREVMEMAQISGPHATSTGLRHGFGVNAVESDVPLPLIQKWMGHSSLEITASYASVHNHSDGEIAARMWNTPTDNFLLNSPSEIH